MLELDSIDSCRLCLRLRVTKRGEALLGNCIYKSVITLLLCRCPETLPSEQTRREFISPVFVLAVLLMTGMRLVAEPRVQGSLGNGPVEYAVSLESIQPLQCPICGFHDVVTTGSCDVSQI